MSALAHYLEEEGVPAVAISLIRLHTEKVRPPRALWVPFELGRPLGAPRNETFQTRVITSALRLLEAASGPVVIEDFPENDPTAIDLPGWQPPFDLAPGTVDLGDRTALEQALRQEVRTIAPVHARFVAANRRTTIGLSGLAVEDCAALMAAFLTGSSPAGPDPPISPVQALRWAVDDVKAYYLEAMSADGAIPSSRQMQSWFWDRTLAACAIIALRRQLLASDDKRSQAIGRMNLVPGVQVQRLGLQ
ncbi:MAG TPA: hypothetical protein VN802_10475 [Stellaceae bacterium]|nr:hypothetical protein [Stellaceae bacterium]